MSLCVWLVFCPRWEPRRFALGLCIDSVDFIDFRSLVDLCFILHGCFFPAFAV
jgi:hypothetical protein